MAARMGSAKSVIHAGTGVAVQVGRRVDVAEGIGVLVTVGLDVSVGSTGVRVGVSRGKNVLHPTRSVEKQSTAKTR